MNTDENIEHSVKAARRAMEEVEHNMAHAIVGLLIRFGWPGCTSPSFDERAYEKAIEFLESLQ